MKCHWKENPILAAGLLMELVYLCSDHLAPLKQALGKPGTVLSGGWIGLAIVLILVGLSQLSSKGKARIRRITFWKKG